MPWYSAIGDNIQRRIGKYLINRYLGIFLEDGGGIDFHQIDNDNDAIVLKNVQLNIQTLNQHLSNVSSSVAFEVVDGYIEQLRVNVPWSTLMTENASFVLTGLTVTVQLKRGYEVLSGQHLNSQDPSDSHGMASSLFYSMYDSFTSPSSAMDMAQECMDEDGECDIEALGDPDVLTSSSEMGHENSDKMRGVHLLANMIDSILNRFQMTFLNSVFRFDYISDTSDHGFLNRGYGCGLELRIDSISYLGLAPNGEADVDYRRRKISCHNIALFTDIFSSSARAESGDHRADCSSAHRMMIPIKVASIAGPTILTLDIGELNEFGVPVVIDRIRMVIADICLHIYPHQLKILTILAKLLSGEEGDELGGQIHHEQYAPLGLSARRDMDMRLERMVVRDLSKSNVLAHCGSSLSIYSEQIVDDDFFDFPVSSSCDDVCQLHKYQSKPKSVEQKRDSEAKLSSTAQHPSLPACEIVCPQVSCVLITHDLFLVPDSVLSGIHPLTCSECSNDQSVQTPVDRLYHITSIMHDMSNQFFSNEVSKNCDYNRLKAHLTLNAKKISFVQRESVDRQLQDSNFALTADGNDGTGVTVRVSSNLSCQSFQIHDKTVDSDAHPVVNVHSETSTLPAISINAKHVRIGSELRNLSKRRRISPIESTSVEIIFGTQIQCSADPTLIDRLTHILSYDVLDSLLFRQPTNTNKAFAMRRKAHPRNRIFSLKFEIESISLSVKFPICNLESLADKSGQITTVVWDVMGERFVHDEELLITAKSLLGNIDLTSSDPMVRNASLVFDSLSVFLDDERLLIVGETGDGCQVDYSKDASRYQDESSAVESERPCDDPNVGVMDDDFVFPDHKENSKHLLTDCSVLTNFFTNKMCHHNISVELGRVQVLIPSASSYEVIYNRLGNDSCLWTPLINRLKDITDSNRGPTSTTLFYPIASIGRCDGNNETGTGLAHPMTPDNLLVTEYIEDLTGVKINFRSGGQIFICLGHSSSEHESLQFLELDVAGATLKLAMGNMCQSSLAELPAYETKTFVVDPTYEVVLASLDCGGNISANLLTLPPKVNHSSTGGVGSIFDINRRHRDDISVVALVASTPAGQPKRQSQYGLSIKSMNTLDSASSRKNLTTEISLSNMGSRIAVSKSEEGLVQNIMHKVLTIFADAKEFPIRGYEPPRLTTSIDVYIADFALILYYPQDSSMFEVALYVGRLENQIRVHDLKATRLDVAIVLQNSHLVLFGSANSAEMQAVSTGVIDILKFDTALLARNSTDDIRVINAKLGGNQLSFHVCVDSLQLLQRFAQIMSSQFADDTPQASSGSRESSPTSSDEGHHTWQQDTPVNVPDLSDAMNDLVVEDRTKDLKSSKRTEVGPVSGGGSTRSGDLFMFSDEGGMDDGQLLPDQAHDSSADSGDYCFLDREVGTGIGASSSDSQPAVRMFSSSSFDNDIGFILQEDSLHFHSTANSSTAMLEQSNQCPPSFPPFASRFTLDGISVDVHLFGGSDFAPRNNSAKREAETAHDSSHDVNVLNLRVQRIHQAIERLNNHYSSSAMGGGRSRRGDQHLELRIDRIQAQLDEFTNQNSEGSHLKSFIQSRFIVLIPAFEILDRMKKSKINKLMSLHVSRSKPKQSYANMFIVRGVAFSPIESEMGRTEVALEVSMQPIRFNVDQDTLLFILDLYTALCCDDIELEITHTQPATSESDRQAGYLSRQFHYDQDMPARQHCEGIVIRSFAFRPSLVIRLDYVAKYVDLRQATWAGLMAGLADLNSTQIVLRSVEYKHGICGLGQLLNLLIVDWLDDIKNSQLPTLISGVGPLSSIVQLLNGMFDLVVLPAEQFRRDGRLLRGIQRGTSSFSTKTTLSMLGLTNRMLGVIKMFAETAFFLLSPSPSVMRNKALTADRRSSTNKSKGMTNSSSTSPPFLVDTVSGLVSNVPAAVLEPLIRATVVTSELIGDVQSHIDPEWHRDEVEHKFKVAGS